MEYKLKTDRHKHFVQGLVGEELPIAFQKTKNKDKSSVLF